ncbi:MAG: hypothetical protein V3U80_01295 [Flavobacteriaceae bacterium]
MKNNIFIIIVLILISINTNAQTNQQFTKQFVTDSGVYGYVKITTKPTTVGGAYIWIQQDAVVIEGINDYTGNMLSEVGVNFPFNCSNCAFYASGEASMQVPGWTRRDYAKFNKGGTINSGGFGKTNQTVHFSASAKKRHNDARSEHGSSWEKTGRVEQISIHNVKGADINKISGFVKKMKLKKLNEERAKLEMELKQDDGNFATENNDSTTKEQTSKEKDNTENNEGAVAKKNIEKSAKQPIKEPVKVPDLSSEKIKAATTVLATAAVLASFSKEVGLGAYYSIGGIEAIGAEGLFLFSKNIGASVNYGVTFQTESENRDSIEGYEYGGGIIFNINRSFGFSVDFQYYQTVSGAYDQNRNRLVFEENGSQIGGSIYLMNFLKLSYLSPASGESYRNSELIGEGSGAFRIGVYTYF